MLRYAQIAAVAFAASFFCYLDNAPCVAQTAVKPKVDSSAATTRVASQTGSRQNYSLLQPLKSKQSATKTSTPMMTGLMLTPMKSNSQAVAKDAIVVLPVAFRQDVHDQHEFVVRNTGSRMLKRGIVRLEAPKGGRIQQVSPKPETVAGGQIEIEVVDLAPGAEQMISISMANPRNEFATFRCSVRDLNWNLSAAKTSAGSTAVKSEQLPGVDVGRSSMMTASSVVDRMLTPGKTSARPVSVTRGNMLLPLAKTSGLSGNSLSYEPEQPLAKTNRKKTRSGKQQRSITTKLTGPFGVRVGREEEYSIEVRNISTDDFGEVIVQLTIPECVRVTVLDRAAWYDAASRKITWKVDSLPIGAVETIRYKAIVKDLCSVEQIVTTGSKGSFESKATLQTTASEN